MSASCSKIALSKCLPRLLKRTSRHTTVAKENSVGEGTWPAACSLAFRNPFLFLIFFFQFIAANKTPHLVFYVCFFPLCLLFCIFFLQYCVQRPTNSSTSYSLAHWLSGHPEPERIYEFHHKAIHMQRQYERSMQAKTSNSYCVLEEYTATRCLGACTN